MTDRDNLITVEVAYALPDKQKIVELSVPRGSTALQAVERSGIEEYFPGLDVLNSPMGIFGQALGTKGMPPAAEYELEPGDRVELYRPLIADPKAVRKQRAAKSRKKKSE